MQLFVKDLTVIDASYLCSSRGVVGESWIVDVVLTGKLDPQNMVLDFALVKKQLKQLIDEQVDHKLLVPNKIPEVECRAVEPGVSYLAMNTAKGSIHLRTPEQGIAMLPTAQISPTSVGSYLESLIPAILPNNVKKVEIKLRPEVISSAYYHYTHGLKKHDGNCQRIAHGHRSMIEIWRAEGRDSLLEKQWAERWADIYLGSIEDQCSVQKLQLANGCEIDDDSHYAFAYQASQGAFEIALPKAIVELIPSDTTVECLAEYILATVQQQVAKEQPMQVVAYEGVGKGAMVTS